MIAVNTWVQQYLLQHPQVRVDADFTSRVVDIVHQGFAIWRSVWAFWQIPRWQRAG